MLKHARLRWVMVATLMLSLARLPMLGQTQPSARSRAQKRFGLAVDRTFQNGLQAKLPPHISTLLGIAQEQECPVMQGVERSGTKVQGIDVSVADKNDVVLFVVDETTNDQTLYLTTAEGRLRKVVSVKAGVGAISRITNRERKAFEMEKQFWVDRLVPAGPSK